MKLMVQLHFEIDFDTYFIDRRMVKANYQITIDSTGKAIKIAQTA